MKVKSIELGQDNEWLIADLPLDPNGTLTVRVRRNSGGSWSVRKSRGEATLTFRVEPSGRLYYQDELSDLGQELSRREFLGVGSEGQLLFEGNVQAYPTALLEPRVPSDNSTDVRRYKSDVPVPGVNF